MGIGKLVRAVIGMPPAGVRQPGVGDGFTTKDRKVKVTMVVPTAKHRGKKHRK
jgi:hypothetical protein